VKPVFSAVRLDGGNALHRGRGLPAVKAPPAPDPAPTGLVACIVEEPPETKFTEWDVRIPLVKGRGASPIAKIAPFKLISRIPVEEACLGTTNNR